MNITRKRHRMIKGEEKVGKEEDRNMKNNRKEGRIKGLTKRIGNRMKRHRKTITVTSLRSINLKCWPMVVAP